MGIFPLGIPCKDIGDMSFHGSSMCMPQTQWLCTSLCHPRSIIDLREFYKRWFRMQGSGQISAKCSWNSSSFWMGHASSLNYRGHGMDMAIGILSCFVLLNPQRTTRTPGLALVLLAQVLLSVCFPVWEDAEASQLARSPRDPWYLLGGCAYV